MPAGSAVQESLTFPTWKKNSVDPIRPPIPASHLPTYRLNIVTLSQWPVVILPDVAPCLPDLITLRWCHYLPPCLHIILCYHAYPLPRNETAIPTVPSFCPYLPPTLFSVLPSHHLRSCIYLYMPAPLHHTTPIFPSFLITYLLFWDLPTFSSFPLGLLFLPIATCLPVPHSDLFI